MVLAMKVPTINTDFGCAYKDQVTECLSASEARDLAKLFELSRTNPVWQQKLHVAVKDILLYYPKTRCEPEVGRTQHARLHIIFLNKHKCLWMDGTHSFAELQVLLDETGVDGFQSLDVTVGLTSMKNKDRGKGLRTKEEQQEIDWLLDRSSKTPKGIKRGPRMLREL